MFLNNKGKVTYLTSIPTHYGVEGNEEQRKILRSSKPLQKICEAFKWKYHIIYSKEILMKMRHDGRDPNVNET